MPQSSARTVRHATLTDHTIRRKPQPSGAGPVPADAKLAPFLQTGSTDRELGLAYASIGLRNGNRTWGMRAVALLEEAIKTYPDDPKVTVQLGQLYDRMGRQQEACDLYARSVVADAGPVAAAVNWGACLAARGRMEEGMRLWQAALLRNPGLEAARLNLAVAQSRSGNWPAAHDTLREALNSTPPRGWRANCCARRHRKDRRTSSALRGWERARTWRWSR